MLINKLETMEKIVKQNNLLSWIGWDVVERKKTEMGRTAVNGVRVNGQWYTQRVFKVDRNGWDIPNKYRM